MEGLEKIKNKILSDARQEAQKLLEDAEKKALSIKEEQNEQTAKLRLKLENEAKANADDHKKRLIAAAELQMRKDTLAAKRQLIDLAFKESISSISELPLAEYKGVIRSMLLSAGIQGEAEIVFSSKDKISFGNGFIDEVNGMLKAQGKDLHLKLSKENGAFLGGFVLIGKGIEINNTLEALVKLARDEAEPLAAKVLFSDSLDRKEDL